MHFSEKCVLITTNCVFDKILTTKGSRIKHYQITVMNCANHREDKFLRTNNKHINNGKHQVTEKKTSRALKPISFISAIILASACLLIPTTTLAPSVDAYADSRAAAYSVGGIDSQSPKTAQKPFLRSLLTKKHRNKQQRQPRQHKRLHSLQQLLKRRRKQKQRQLSLSKKKKKPSRQKMCRLIL